MWWVDAFRPQEDSGHEWLAQGDALRDWHEHRDLTDVGVVLNTGAGKTLVGLLIAQFRDKKALILVPGYGRAKRWNDIASPPDPGRVTEAGRVQPGVRDGQMQTLGVARRPDR